MKFINELQRRNVIKETLAYLVVSWIILQVASIVLPMMDTPNWVLKTVTFFLAIGLPFWVVFSWVYQITPDGLKKTKKISEEPLNSSVTNKRLNIIIIVTLILAITISFVNKPLPKDELKTIVNSEFTNENSIAVLPFVNMSGDEEQEYFADGLSEELINVFTKIPELRVIGRTSSFAFKGKNEDLRDIGDKLDVKYLLEGSVRKSGNKIRITAQLIKVIDGSHLWSKTFDRNLDDIFKIQDDISVSVVNALSITLLNNYIIPENKVIDPEAYNYFLRGRYYYELDFGGNSTDEALIWFNKAIELDSTFSLPWTYLGMCYWRNSSNSLDDNFVKAKEASIKAFELDPSSGIAAVNLGEILDNEYDFQGALEMIDLGLELEPNNPYVLRNAGRFYTILGRETGGIEYCQRALKNDPIQRTALGYLLSAYYYAEEYDAVKQLYYKNKEVYPYIIESRGAINVLAMEKYNIEILEAVKKINTSESLVLYTNLLLAVKANDNKEAEEILTQLIEKNSHRRYRIALAYAGMGENSKAIDWLEKSFAFKDKSLVYVNVEPKFDVIRDSIRFKNLVKQMDFPK
jgi:adenylate cyclase